MSSFNKILTAVRQAISEIKTPEKPDQPADLIKWAKDKALSKMEAEELKKLEAETLAKIEIENKAKAVELAIKTNTERLEENELNIKKHAAIMDEAQAHFESFLSLMAKARKIKMHTSPMGGEAVLQQPENFIYVPSSTISNIVEGIEKENGLNFFDLSDMFDFKSQSIVFADKSNKKLSNITNHHNYINPFKHEIKNKLEELAELNSNLNS